MISISEVIGDIFQVDCLCLYLCREFENVIHALSCGAVSSVTICANITVSVITFTAVTMFVNSMLQFIGVQLNMSTTLSFEVNICEISGLNSG